MYKDLHYTLDDNDDDNDNDGDELISDSMNLDNHFTSNKILYDNVNINKLLDDEEYDHADGIINCKNYPITYRIKKCIY